ncbi:hypothetical protein BpHYR1_032310 [Brachionus plicatilis]|uniref:Uncharacterized protein n=1 Tax=Brachionus plicatilis TaxID=10195 RepID=A0A3M7Q527_BRAPC|nr:hypothetical protein BpHYR1_032310 [Brachionus plicatilis]
MEFSFISYSYSSSSSLFTNKYFISYFWSLETSVSSLSSLAKLSNNLLMSSSAIPPLIEHSTKS